MPKLEDANIVLIGNFNPYIISPEWLAELKIWNSKEVSFALGALDKEGVQFRGSGVEWFVSSSQMIIKSIMTDCGALADKVLSQLPHTPMVAVGSNFNFACDVDKPGTVFQTIEAVTPAESHELARWGTVFHEDATRIEVVFIHGNEGMSAAVNFHYSTALTTEASKATQRFEHNRERATALVENMIERQMQ